MKIKCLCMLGLLLSLFFINNTPCSAVRSGIFEVRNVYSSDRYDVYVYTNLIENELVNYYSYRKIDMTISKRVKSASYVEYIKDVIREYYRPPLWRPEAINEKIDSAFSNGALWIKENIYMNFRDRTIGIGEESLWSAENNNEQILVNIPMEATLHTDYSYVDMDNSPEYGSIANASIDFLESIKEIYFDPNKGKEYELKIIRSRDADFYLRFMENKWEKAPVTISEDKRQWTNFFDIYIDVKSIRRVGDYYEGWVQFVYDLDKINAKLAEKGKTIYDIFENPPLETFYYVRYDHNNKRFLIIAASEKFIDNTTKKYVLSEPEFWTYKDNPDVVATVLDKAAHQINKIMRY